jgi:hypothetical protein
MYRDRLDVKIAKEAAWLVDDLMSVFRSLFVNKLYRGILDIEKDVELFSTLMLNPRYGNINFSDMMDAMNTYYMGRSSMKKPNLRVAVRTWCETSIKKGLNLKNVPSDGKTKDYGDKSRYKGRYTTRKRS